MTTQRMTGRQVLERIVFYGALALLAIWTLGPIYWTFTTSFKSGAEMFSWPPTYIPLSPVLTNYDEVLRLHPVVNYMVNSLIVMAVSTPISVALASMAAYGLSRFSFPGKDPLMFLLLAVRMLPALIIALPLFMMFGSLGLHDTLLGLIIVYTVFNLPFNIWLLHGFFVNVSTEIEDSSKIDGCNPWQTFTKVMIPLVAPGLVASAIFCMLLSWNEFAFALTLTYTGQSQTLPIAIAGMTSDRGTLFGQMGAVGTLAILPVLAVAIYVQKYLVRGLTAGAVKG